MKNYRKLSLCCNTKLHCRVLISILVIGIPVFFGCSHKEKVVIPPNMDLRGYGTIGIIDFSSNAKKELKQSVTQEYIQAVQGAQPGLRILELGGKEQVLKKVNQGQLDPAAIRAIGSAYHVDVLVFGQLTVTEVKPNIRLSLKWQSMNVGADIEASLMTKLWQTDSGVTLWTKSSRHIESVARIKADTSGNIDIGASDPNDSYGKLIPNLVHTNTKDFRSRYTYRRVKKNSK